MQVASEKRRQQQEAQDADLLQCVMDGLSYTTGPTAAVRETLSREKRTRADKRAALHAAWTAGVYDKIQGRLQTAVNALSDDDIQARLRRNMQAYLTNSNNKRSAVFRDVINVAEYDPLRCAKENLRIFTGDVVDACKMGGATQLGPTGREVLPTVMWDKLDSTPYGHCTAPDGSSIVRPVDEKLAALQRSHVHMDHYTYPDSNAAADAEMPKGKAPIVPLYVTRTGRGSLFDIMQRADAGKTTAEIVAAGGAADDTWLGHKGRRVVQGPELRRGRRNLYDVVHHTCVEGLQKNPGFTGGDEWLERKGRRSVPGPEQRRGRKSLFETFQMSSNPFHDGRTLDDIFLERKGRKALPGPSEGGDMYNILQDQQIEVAQAPREVARYYVSELVPVDGSLTTRTVPSLTKRVAA